VSVGAYGASPPRGASQRLSPSGCVGGRGLAAIAARDHAVFVQPALERAVVQHGAPRGLQADEAREIGIAGEDERGPAGEAPLQHIAQLRIETREPFLLAE